MVVISASNYFSGSVASNRAPAPSLSQQGVVVIILGIVLFIVGLVAHIAVLETIGVILVAVGLVLALRGRAGRAVGGRRHYW